MTLILIERLRHVQHGATLVRLGTKIFTMAAELRRRKGIEKALARLSPRDLRDIGLTPNDIECVGSRPLAHDVATELHHKALLRCGNW